MTTKSDPAAPVTDFAPSPDAPPGPAAPSVALGPGRWLAWAGADLLVVVAAMLLYFRWETLAAARLEAAGSSMRMGSAATILFTSPEVVKRAASPGAAEVLLAGLMFGLPLVSFASSRRRSQQPGANPARGILDGLAMLFAASWLAYFGFHVAAAYTSYHMGRGL